MPDEFEVFCSDCRDALAREPGHGGRERVRQLLERLLAEPSFVAEHVGEDAEIGRHQIYRDASAGFCVLVYNTRAPRVSPPHDHGDSWAIYGQVAAYTDMTVYRRADGAVGAGPASLEEAGTYRLDPGQAGLYDVGDVHSIDYPAGARFVRVTGTDLDEIPRLKYDLERGVAATIESATVS